MKLSITDDSEESNYGFNRRLSKKSSGDDSKLHDFISTGIITPLYKRVKEEVDDLNNKEETILCIKLNKLKELLSKMYPEKHLSIDNYFVQKYKLKIHERENEIMKEFSTKNKTRLKFSKANSFVLYDNAYSIDSSIDSKVSHLIEKKEINYYNDCNYVNLMDVDSTQLEDFDRLMNIWDFLMMTREILDIQPFTPLDLSRAITESDETVFIQYIFSHILELVTKNLLQKDSDCNLLSDSGFLASKNLMIKDLK